jgi:hypothetical protein
MAVRLIEAAGTPATGIGHGDLHLTVLYKYSSKGEPMADDPFERARKEMERAQRDLHERIQRAHGLRHRGMEEALRRIAEARAVFQDPMERFRAQMQQAGRHVPSGPKKPSRGRSGRNGKPWDPDDEGPQPVPVRPNKPSLLSGGAEAPLDE